MTRCRFPALFAFVIAAQMMAETVFGQTVTQQLLVGDSIVRSLDWDERHAYAVRLDSGQFLFATVQQRGIDVYSSVLDTNGRVLASGIDLGGSNGLESISYYPETTGWYWIGILPHRDQYVSGDYSLTLERLEPAAHTTSGMIDQMFAHWDRRGSPGAAVAVVRNGEIVHAKGYGSAQLEYDIPIEPTTVFHMASVSKQFTAFAIALLASEGRLSLDDDIRIYLPELIDYGHPITIRHLLHHTSGLRDQWNLLAMAGWRMDDVFTRDQILRLVVRQRELNYEPGTEYLYTNTGFTLLAEIVERVTGQRFSDWTAEHLFEPLGMAHTHFHDDHRAIVPNRAYSYQAVPAGGYGNAVLSYANVGATSLFSTVEDLARWSANFETGEVGGPDLIRLMRSRGVLNNGDTLYYAMGQAIGTYRGLRALYHGGADAGFRTYLLRFPHQRLNVAVLSNLAGFDAGGIARRIAELYLDDQMTAATTETLANDGLVRETESNDMIPTRSRNHIGDYVGDYDLGTGIVLSVSARGNRLMVNASGQQPTTLIPTSDDRYVVEGGEQQFLFERDSTGNVTDLVVDGLGPRVSAYRTQDIDPSSIRLTDFEGTFHAEELGTAYTLEVVADTLVATHLRLGSIALSPCGPDAFFGNRWYFRRLEFERNSTGEITGFRASNGRVRSLLFEKQ